MDQKLLKALETEGKPKPLASTKRYYKGFLYGEYGVGKTKLCGDLVQKKGLCIATDTGPETFFNHPELLDKIDIVEYQGLSHITAIASAIAEGATVGETDYSEYDLVWVDTVSQVQEEYLDFLNDNFTYTGNYREKAMPRDPRSGLTVQEVIGQPDYHLTRNHMRHPIKSLIKAPVDVIFTAHLREPSPIEQGKGKITKRPTLTETVFKLIAREATWMGLMEREGTKRTIQFETTKKSVAKSRIAELDNKVINADALPNILHEWKRKNSGE